MTRVCVVGAGAVGGNLVARLANAGVDVTVIARGANATAINANGLTLKSPAGTIKAHPRVCTNMEDAGVHDVVFVVVKAHSIPELAAELPLLCDAYTPVVFLMNGVPWWYPLGNVSLPHAWPDLGFLDPGGALARSVGIERVIGTVVYSGNTLVEPGVVQSTGAAAGTIGIGEPDLSPGERTHNERPPGERIVKLQQLLESAGYQAPISSDIRHSVWLKLVGANLGSMGLCTLLGKSMLIFNEDPGLASLYRSLLREGMAVAAAWGYPLSLDPEGANDPAKTVNRHKPSMAQDFDHGRPLEIDPIFTAFQRLARAASVPTPHFDAVMALLVHRAIDAGLYRRL